MESVAGRRAPATRRASAAVARAAKGAWRPLRAFILSALVQVPLHVALLTGGLSLAFWQLSRLLPPDSVLRTAGAVSLTTLALAIGIVAGLLAGLAQAARRGTDVLEAVLREQVLAMDGASGERLIAARPLADVRAAYDGLLDAIVREMFGRVPVPGLVRRLARRALRQAIVEDFLADCEAREVAAIGFGEVRNWTVARGIPCALSPVRSRLRLVRMAVLCLAGATVVLALILGFAAGGAITGT